MLCIASQKKNTQVVSVDECLGAHEHFYDISEIEGVASKHYLATAYRSHLEDHKCDSSGNTQHSAIEVFHRPFDDPHPHVHRYLNDL